MMEHKAFLFDYDAFERELRPILEDALRSGDCGVLVSFITRNLRWLRGPYEGDVLRADWQAMIETKDAHQYGDFALTKYYDATADVGLGAAWQSIQDLLARDPTLAVSPMLGSAIGPKDEPFDPGKMGSYFQSPDDVRAHYRYLLSRASTEPSDDLSQAMQMLEAAVKAKKGLYVTF
jgi:hypothetical protein